MDTLDQVRAATRSHLTTTPVRTRIPGWKNQADKAFNLLKNWCEIVGLPASYGQKIFDWFDKAPEPFSFANAMACLSEDRQRVIVSCEVEKGRGFDNFVKEFSLTELAE